MIKRYTELRRKAWWNPVRKEIHRYVRLRPMNPERILRRAKAYAAHLKSAFFKALRVECFERDGYRCTAIVRAVDGGVPTGADGEVVERCPVTTRRHLRCHHLTYARFGHELLSDLATLCRWCHDARHASDAWKLARRLLAKKMVAA